MSTQKSRVSIYPPIRPFHATPRHPHGHQRQPVELDLSQRGPTVTSTCQITNEGVAAAAEAAGYRLEHQVYYENGYVYIYI